MLRASNSGTTMVVDPLGRVTARLAEGEVALVDAVPSERLEGETLFTRLGDWPFFALLGLGLLASVWAARRDRRKGA